MCKSVSGVNDFGEKLVSEATDLGSGGGVLRSRETAVIWRKKRFLENLTTYVADIAYLCDVYALAYHLHFTKRIYHLFLAT